MSELLQIQKPEAGSRKPQESSQPSTVADTFSRWGSQLLQSRWWPGIIQVPTLLVFLVIFYAAFFGPADPRRNFATVMSWIVWWPLLAVTYFVFGRIWCAACPMITIGDFLQKYFSFRWKAPNFLKKRYLGAIVLLMAILYQAWVEEVTGASYSPLVTGLILLSFTAGAVISDLLFERHVWCRYLCPLGAWIGVFSMSSIMEVRADKRVCESAKCKGIYCYTGRDGQRGCAWINTPRTMATNRYCSMCGDCFKACPHGSLSLRLRPPTREVEFNRKENFEDAMSGVAAIGVVAFQGLVMLDFWHFVRSEWKDTAVFGSSPLVYGTAVLSMVLASVGLFLLAALVHSRISGEPIRQNLSLFGFAFLPLVLMSHISHNLGMMTHQTHLILPAVAGLFGYQVEPDHLSTLLSPGAWHILHAGIILVGTAMTLWLIRRICRIKQEGGCPRYASLPYAGLAVAYTIAFFLILHPDMLLRV